METLGFLGFTDAVSMCQTRYGLLISPFSLFFFLIWSRFGWEADKDSYVLAT